MASFTKHPVTGKWRSSKKLIVGTACVALFTETLLGGFPVPMLPYMLEDRLHNDPSQTSDTTNRLLSLHGFVTMICSPLFAKLFDKTSSQKGPLFLSLGLCLLGTALVASTPTLWALYLGRVLQAVAGSAAWLVCTAMITENAREGGIGTAMGLSTSFIMVGTVSGPMLGGVLLGWFGYWAAWSVPMALLFLDMIARMVVRRPEDGLRDLPLFDEVQDREPDSVDPNLLYTDVKEIPTETSPLLPASPCRPPSTLTIEESEDGSDTEVGSDSDSIAETRNVYAVMLRDVSIWASILNTVVQAMVRASFNATLPIHLRNTFKWGPSSVGATFFALQVPIVFLSPLLGWFRDRVGVRLPTTIGWALLCPSLCFLGITGNGMQWFSGSQEIEQKAFIVCICSIGLFLPIVQGAGALHMRNVVGRLEKETPNIFGPNGGRARCFAMISVSFNTGLTLGPAVAGALFGTIGYCYMNIVLGAVCLGVAVITFLFIDI